jgi:S1-C subfamily serine protease
MKKIINIFAYLLISITALSQSYSSSFYSEEAIRKYYEANIDKLDPMEGKYDVQVYVRTNSPIQADYDYSLIYYVVKQPYSNKFTVYIGKHDEFTFGKSDNVSIESIGTTNAYRLYFRNSSNRGVLDNNLRYTSTVELSLEDARHFWSNPNWAYRLILKYDFVKAYPTGTMYADAARKAEARIIEEEKKRREEEAKRAGWTGTGFALKDGYIVTNYHVIEDATNITIQGVKGDFANKLTAQVVASDKYNDIAILKINDSRFTGFGTIPYLVKTSISDVAEDIFVLGYPMTSTMGDEIKYTTGVISSKTGFQGDVSQYQISAPVQPGNSGGPLFDSKGNVIGIVSAKHTGAENVGYAIKTSYLKNLIESVLSTNILPVTNTGIQTLSNAEKVKKIKSFVFLINASTQTTTSTQRHTTPSTSASNSTPIASTSRNQTYTSKVEGTTPKTSNPGVSNSFVNKKGERIVQSEEATIKVGDLVYAELEGKQVERWEISSYAASFVATQDEYKLKALKEGNVQVWGYIDGSPKLFKFKIVNTNTTLPGDKPIKTITSKECTINVGDHITAKLPEGDVEMWEINKYQGEYVDIGQHILVAKKSGVICVWGYINNSPKLFKITIK